MNPTTDALYLVHTLQAARRGQPPLAQREFHARMAGTYETELTGLLAPPAGVTIQIQVPREPKFTLGQVCITPNAAEAVTGADVLQSLARHAAGDWGALDEHDRMENERALSHRGRLFSVYEASTGQKFWVITEAGFELTTVLLPKDY